MAGALGWTGKDGGRDGNAGSFQSVRSNIHDLNGIGPLVASAKSSLDAASAARILELAGGGGDLGALGARSGPSGVDGMEALDDDFRIGSASEAALSLLRAITAASSTTEALELNRRRDLDAPIWSRPTEAEVRALVVATWPEDADTALAVARCESSYGQHARTYDLDAENAGPMQINRFWAIFFEHKYGWSWADVAGVGAEGLGTHFAAAREVYSRAGNTWLPWACAP